MCDAFDLNNGKVSVAVASCDHQKTKFRTVAGVDGFWVASAASQNRSQVTKVDIPLKSIRF